MHDFLKRNCPNIHLITDPFRKLVTPKMFYIFIGESISRQLSRIMPDYLLVFAVPLLAHLPSFASYDDFESLQRLQSALWFVMEPLLTRNDNFSFNFYKAMIEKMKGQRDKANPEDDATNYVSVLSLNMNFRF